MNLRNTVSVTPAIGASTVAGRTETVPRFTWDRLVDRLDAVYREVLGA